MINTPNNCLSFIKIMIKLDVNFIIVWLTIHYKTKQILLIWNLTPQNTQRN
jgi:hypothetical protein